MDMEISAEKRCVFCLNKVGGEHGAFAMCDEDEDGIYYCMTCFPRSGCEEQHDEGCATLVY